MDNVLTVGTESVRLERTHPAATPRSIGGVRFDWAVIALSSWFLGGVYLDGWAHHHIPELETFFTPWHGVLYSGFLATAALLVATLIRNNVRGHAWRQALPAGYMLSLLGVPIFLAGGVGDMIWHELFGIEADVEALLSPTHLILALGGTLMVSGPLRAAWRRSEDGAGRLARWPMLLSLTFTLSVLTFMTQFAHPSVEVWAAPSGLGHHATTPIMAQALGVASILLQAALLVGFVLLAVRRWGWRLPWGSLTLLMTLNVALLSVLEDEYRLIPAAFLAGLVADLLLRRLQPSPDRPVALRLFACAVPAVYYLLYFLTLMGTEGIWWSVHLWTGSIVLTGIVGWLLSYAFVPPTVPGEEAVRLQ